VASGEALDDLGEARAHHLLKAHSLFDHRRAVAALEQGALDARVAAAHQADDEVAGVVGLRLFGADAVVLLEQRDDAIADSGKNLAVKLAVARGGVALVHGVGFVHGVTTASPVSS